MAQLSLFEEETAGIVKDPGEWHWKFCFPEFVPAVGSYAMINDTFTPGFGYSSGQRVIITEFDGVNVTCLSQMNYPNDERTGSVIRCTLANIWPDYRNTTGNFFRSRGKFMRSKGRLKYKRWNIHERINWKSYYWGMESILQFIESDIINDDVESTTNEMSQPCDLNFFCNGKVKASESTINTINDGIKRTN